MFNNSDLDNTVHTQILFFKMLTITWFNENTTPKHQYSTVTCAIVQCDLRCLSKGVALTGVIRNRTTRCLHSTNVQFSEGSVTQYTTPFHRSLKIHCITIKDN